MFLMFVVRLILDTQFQTHNKSKYRIFKRVLKSKIIEFQGSTQVQNNPIPITTK
ncbi:hypothetical protein Leryth_027586 [Lithospermum erythrorhizon]|nr:hypothetical protein Leryth_027586 [Lithospermum erythrorhizon]